MDDRVALLESLKIDRTAPERGGGPSWALAAGLSLICLLVGAGAVYWVMPRQSTPAPALAEATAPAQSQGQTTAAPAPQDSAAPAPVPGTRVLDASGYIVARRRATVSAEISGRVEALLIEEGQQVAAGEVVARLDAALARVNLDLARAQVASSEASIQRIEADLAEARRVLERTQELSDRDFSSRADLTRSEAQVAALAADLARAKADLSIARLQVSLQAERLDDHVIRAPFAGVVIDKNAQEGEIIFPGSAGGGFTRTGVCTLVDMDSLEIEVDVNEAYINRVSAGQGVVAKLDAYPDWEIPAEVIAIVPTANRDKATVQVRIALKEKDARILPDMGVKVSFLEKA